MKIESYIIIFLIFVSGYVITDNIKMDKLQKAQFDYDYVDRIFQNAFEDAFDSFLYSDEYNKTQTNELAVERYFTTIKNSLGLSQDELVSMKLHVPFAVVIDYDGFMVYSIKEVKTSNGIENQFIYMPKQRFSHIDNGVLYGFDIRSNIKVRYNLDDEIYMESGTIEELLNNSSNSDMFKFLKTKDIEKVIKQLMLKQISDYLNHILKNHITIARAEGYDVDIDFDILNRLDKSMVDSKGFMVFSSGIAISNTLKYENMEFKKIISTELKPEYYGFKYGNVLYAAKAGEPILEGKEVIDIFSSLKEAASFGYHGYRE